MNVIPFEPEHMALLEAQQRQRLEISHLVRPYLAGLRDSGPALTAVKDGKVLACAGIAVLSFGAGTLWAAVSQDAGRHFVKLDRCVRRFLEIPRLRRIEASAEADFAQGCRWLELLGFHSEGTMRQYGPNGEDHIRYAKVWPSPSRSS